MRNSPLVSKALLGLALMAGRAAAQTAAEQQSSLAAEHFRQVRELYNQRAWASSQARAGFPWLEFAPSGWQGEAERTDGGLLTRHFKRLEPAQSPRSFWIELHVAQTSAKAQETLIGWLAGVSRPQALPSTSSWQLDVGDVGFVGPSGAGDKAIAWLGFVRGNIALRLVATDPTREPTLEIGGLAREFDQAIRSQRILADGEQAPTNQIELFSASKVDAIAGERIPLSLLFAPSMSAARHFDWTVGGTGQGYVEQDSSGRYVLHTTGPGKIELAVAVTGALGWTSTRSLEVLVSDD